MRDKDVTAKPLHNINTENNRDGDQFAPGYREYACLVDKVRAEERFIFSRERLWFIWRHAPYLDSSIHLSKGGNILPEIPRISDSRRMSQSAVLKDERPVAG